MTRSVNFLLSDIRLKCLKTEERVARQDSLIQELRKALSDRDAILKNHGLENLTTTSIRDASHSIQKSLRTWKASLGFKNKIRKEKAGNIQVTKPNVQRVGSLPSKITKPNLRFGESIASKATCSKGLKKNDQSKKHRLSSQSKGLKETKIKKETVNLKEANQHKLTPGRKDFDNLFTVEQFQRSHSAPNRSSSRIALAKTYYIGKPQALKKEDKQEKQIDQLDSLDSSLHSLDLSEHDLTLQKRLKPFEPSPSLARKLTFSHIDAKVRDSMRALLMEEKENFDLNDRLFNSPAIFELNEQISKCDIERQPSIKILDNFQISLSKQAEVVQRLPQFENNKTKAGQGDKKLLHRRNSTRFNGASNTSRNPEEIYSRIERNIRSSHSSGKRCQQQATGALLRKPLDDSGDEFVLLGSLKKSDLDF